MEVGELISKGEQGKHLGWHKDVWYLVVVDGTIKSEDKEFGILRSIYPISYSKSHNKT